MADEISFRLQCPECGEAPDADEPLTDSSRIRCFKCDLDLGSYGDMRARAIEASKVEVRKVISKAFKKK